MDPVVAGPSGIVGPPVFVASLCFSVIVSRQRQQIERLIEETAILSAELRELRSGRTPQVDAWQRPASEKRGA